MNLILKIKRFASVVEYIDLLEPTYNEIIKLIKTNQGSKQIKIKLKLVDNDICKKLVKSFYGKPISVEYSYGHRQNQAIFSNNVLTNELKIKFLLKDLSMLEQDCWHELMHLMQFMLGKIGYKKLEFDKEYVKTTDYMIDRAKSDIDAFHDVKDEMHRRIQYRDYGGIPDHIKRDHLYDKDDDDSYYLSPIEFEPIIYSLSREYLNGSLLFDEFINRSDFFQSLKKHNIIWYEEAIKLFNRYIDV